MAPKNRQKTAARTAGTRERGHVPGPVIPPRSNAGRPSVLNLVSGSLMETMYDVIRYQVAPPLLVVVCTLSTQWMAAVGRGSSTAFIHCFGNTFSWSVVIVMFLWALLWLHLPSSKTYGPVTITGETPVYQDNGVAYYWASLLAFVSAQAAWPQLSIALYESHPQLLGTLNIIALLLCWWLLCRGRRNVTGERRRPIVYEFYRGMELHPRFLGVDLKQLTNCRIGLMCWQLLIIAFYVAGVEKHGFKLATLVNLLLQSVYVAKFFWWESGYFHTLDITLDRAGYYICWGCLVWVPCVYTFSSYYMVAHPPTMGALGSLVAFALGIASILLNYRVDYEKQIFRNSADGRVLLWGREAEFLVAEFTDSSGFIHESRLLISGSWGLARHLNYTFEILSALAWSLPAFGLGVLPFFYFIFLVILLVHRTFRDEEKCALKYGSTWNEYCRRVPCRFIPYLI